MPRLDVCGSRKDKLLKSTFEVEKGNWKEALTQAKRYAGFPP